MNITVKENLDYIVVLGASVYGETPSNALQSRIDTAYKYLVNNPDTFVIASGGKGKGENISEGECIARSLIKKGITAEKILIEDRSKTTVQNIRNSYKMISGENRKIGIVTNNFHVFRAVKTAKSMSNYKVYGIPSPYTGILLPHYIVREFVTLVTDIILGNIAVLNLK